MEPILIAENLRKKFGDVLAVNAISFEVQEGEIFGILGPNGAGKSTTLAIITGLVKAGTGTIRISGYDLKTNYKQAVKDLGVLIENPGFYGHLSAPINLRIMGRFRESSPAKVLHILDKVGLGAYTQKKVKTFSQGMRKRLGLANALLGGPSLLILDEPTSGLDPKGTKDILDLIKSLAVTNKTAVVISSNRLDDIETVCDRTLIIKEGRALLCKPVKDLLGFGDQYYGIRVEPLEKALSVIRTMPGVRAVQRADEHILYVSLSGLSPAELNRRLISQGFDIFELSPIKKSLKELFLGLEN